MDDPNKIVLPKFDSSIFDGSRKIGSKPEEIIAEIGIMKDEVVADFGCGVGYFVLEVARIIGDNGKIYAVDLDQKVLDSLKSKALESGMKNIYGILANLETPGSTKIPDNSCDVVLIINLLYLIEKKKEVLGEAYRILKTSGKMVIMDWSHKMGASILNKEDHVNVREVRDISRAIGFRFLKSFEAGISHEINIYIRG